MFFEGWKLRPHICILFIAFTDLLNAAAYDIGSALAGDQATRDELGARHITRLYPLTFFQKELICLTCGLEFG